MKELKFSVLSNGTIEFEWSELDAPSDKNKEIFEEEIYNRFQKDFASGLLFLSFFNKTIPLSSSVQFLKSFTGKLPEKLARVEDVEEKRESLDIPLSNEEADEIIRNAPFITGSEYLDVPFLQFIWSRLVKKLGEELKKYTGTVESFIRSYSPDVHLIGRIYFHLVENKDNNDYPFAFLATYSTNMGHEGKSKHVPLKFALEEYGNDSQKLLDLLTTVHLAAKESSFVTNLLDSGEIFHPLALSSNDAFTFLKEITLYEKCGILCRIPNWWKSSASPFKVRISAGNTSQGFLGMDSLLDFNAQLLLGDSEISVDEAKRILAESEGLAYIKGKWIPVDKDKLAEVLSAYDTAKKRLENNELSLTDILRMQLGTDSLSGISPDKDIIEISHGDWLGEVMDKLRQPNLIKAAVPAKDFKATLRPYQHGGLNWLSFLHSLKFGACLADDMGLGKTIEMLAFLCNLKEERKRNNKTKHAASLLVVPASLLSNWQNEIEKWAPHLEYYIVHTLINADSAEKIKDKKNIDSFDLLITTYGLVQKYEALHAYPWNYVILDEAQAIKNPGTKQTRAVKSLKSYNRIVMTGTPIENRLSDVWSLFDFINPGLLGNSTEFSNFIKGLDAREEGYAKLKQVISPYILRRLKTDKSIISDLPDKIEMKTYSDLSTKQILLYEKLINDIKRGLAESEGIERKGIILASLVKFKQICNHPDQFLGNTAYDEKESGKFSRLKEICETIYEKREKVLVFTQFREMTDPLHRYLQTIFNKEGLTLHGGTPVNKRKEIVEKFQNGNEYVPYFVLSVKAGGVGLNLTEANHVIHFDRWWNPAVENQATDRAFRIGQNKKVIVHKFVTKGTVEEKIDAMIESKMSLSKEIINTASESWITEMKNEEVLDLFKLTLH